MLPFKHKPYFKCGLLGITIKKIQNETISLRCTGKNSLQDCTEEIPNKYPNCAYANDKYGVKKEVSQLITVPDNCDILKSTVINTITYILDRRVRFRTPLKTGQQ